jgi:hypothetical protein
MPNALSLKAEEADPKVEEAAPAGATQYPHYHPINRNG